jgi:chemotaxis protein methyltransferase CheR
MSDCVSDAQWSKLGELIARKTGLHFPFERRADLRRGMEEAARELGFEDIPACIGGLLSASPTPAQIEVLANHLTVGETYFFRERKTFDVLSTEILPGLILSRRGRNQRLRIWSAACCTGEEPYSLAILLHERVPDLRDWHVTILATDINARFLRKAAAGVYGEWSFRDSPSWLKARYFIRMSNGRYAIRPEIRKLVTFSHLNLVEDVYPSLTTDTNAMDMIFCRNALIYFTPHHARKVIRGLRHALIEGGWLAVSPSETSHTLFHDFVSVNFPGVILYRKSDAKRRSEQPWMPAPLGATAENPARAIEMSWTEAPAPDGEPAGAALPEEQPAREDPVPTPFAAAELLYRRGRYAEAADMLSASFAEHAPEPQAFSLLARALANRGELSAALTWCDCWIAADKLDPAAHYLRAVVLLEHGEPEQARSSLQRAIYLRPDFVLAHFALGNLTRSQGRFDMADRHFANALHLLNRYRSDDLLPDSENLTAGRLIETITALTGAGVVP